jgi:hypothetical protein
MADNAQNHTAAPAPRGGVPAPRSAPSGSARIVTQLRRAILDGDYGYRERVPSERELAADFGAARGRPRPSSSSKCACPSSRRWPAWR